ncbi:MAG: RHS repeat domain-containing protein, partial [Phycisphaerales bacterium JB039]
LDRDGDVDLNDMAQVGSAKSALPAGWISDAGSTSLDNMVGYDGYLFLPASEQYHVRFRCYDPELGRWLERDPIGYVDGSSLYLGVRSTPTRFTDPLGLACDPPNADPYSKQRLERSLFPEHFPRREWVDDVLRKLSVFNTLLEEVSPDINISLGVYKSIDETFECCKDGRIYECKKSGFHIFFGLKIQFEAEWKVEAEIEMERGCPPEGRYHQVMGGPEAKIKLGGAGGKARYEFGALLTPDGDVIQAGECEGSLSLPGGLGYSLKGKTGDEAVAEIVASVKASFGAAGTVKFGSYSTWTVKCEKTTRCCED